MSVELIHYAPAPLVLDRERQYQWHRDAWDKPAGLWCSIGTAWADWTADNMPEGRRTRWAVGTVIELVDPLDDELLILSSWAELVEMSREYRESAARWWRIEWNVIAAHFAGVVLALDPHELTGEAVEQMLTGKRDIPTWCLGWDVPCACIWDMGVIR